MSTDNKVHFLQRHLQGHVQLPSNVKNPRLISRASTSRVLVAADGLIMGFDMETIRPRLLDSALDALPDFVDDDTLLVSHSVKNIWQWVDITTGHKTNIELDTIGPMFRAGFDAPSGRVLVASEGPRGTTLSLLRKGMSTAKQIAVGPDVWGILVPGNAVIYNTGDSRVMAVIGDAPPREVAKLTGIPTTAFGYAHHKVVVHSSEGELVRIDLDTNDSSDRTSITITGQAPALTGDTTGRIVIADDRRVLLWGTAGPTQIAEFEQPIRMISYTEGVVTVVQHNNETYILDKLEPNVQPIRAFPPGRIPPRISADGRLLITLGNADQIEALELPARTRWSVPVYYKLLSSDGAIVSPTKRRVLQKAHGRIIIWSLPLAPKEDFAQWIDEHTNATVDSDGTILWPWQKPNPK